MLIINADDWGGWYNATNTALACYRFGRINSVTAMVFMEDSERAANIACEAGMNVGLHLNFTQLFTALHCPEALLEHQKRTSRFLKKHKYSQIIYNPFLRESFRYLYLAQTAEFQRLYRRYPTHIDGHQHMHLCMNMLVSNMIPFGLRVRRSFSFLAGEKSVINCAYRRWVDSYLARRYMLTDYFYSLATCLQNNNVHRVELLARDQIVELMTHPEKENESSYLFSNNMKKDFETVYLPDFIYH